MAGLTPIFTAPQVERWMKRYTDRSEEKMIRVLMYAGERFVTLARDHGAYTDQTGNLRSSIGYMVLYEGDVVEEDYRITGKGSEGPKGVSEARRLAAMLATTHNKGLVLIGMAGMNYALAVENIKGKDVISSSEVIAQRMVKDLLKKTLNG